MHGRAVLVGVAVAGLLAACGGGGDDSGGGGSESTGAFCSDFEAVVTTGTDLTTALFGGDAATAEEALRAYPDLVDAAQASAPPEIADDVGTATAASRALAEALEGVDLSDSEAVESAFAGVAPGAEAEAAADRVAEYSRAECGFDPDAETESAGSSATSASEPGDPCTLVDPQVVASAAGVTVDVTDEDGGGDVDLGSFATRSCSYGNGQMVISTITYPGDAGDVREQFVDNTERNDGTIHEDVDLGSLPASTLVTDVGGFLTVNVLEAPTPFGVGFSGLDDPAAAVAAAEAVLAAL